MVSMVRQYSIYTPCAVYTAWGHNPQEALERVQMQFPEKQCSVEDIYNKQDEIDALDKLLDRALPYLMLLQRVRGEDDELLVFNGEKGYTVHLDVLGDLDTLIKEICCEDGKSDQPLDESLCKV